MEQATETRTWKATVLVFTGSRTKKESEVFKCSTAASTWTAAKKHEWKGYEVTSWVL